MRTADPWRRSVAAAAVCLLTLACGQKGPPLAPLHLVPAAVTDVTVRRVADRAQLHFVLPSRNANGPGRLDLDHVEIYAMTVPPGFVPPNRQLLTKEYLVGQLAVRPAPIEGQEEPPAKPVEEDKRPGPGEAVMFDDELTSARLTPITPPPAPVTKPPKPTQPPTAKKPPVATPVATVPGPLPAAADVQSQTATVPPVPALPAASGLLEVPGIPVPPAPIPAPVGEPVRIYVVVGVTKSGRQGPPSTRVQVPVLPLPPAPATPTARVTETGIVIEWKPNEEAPKASFNVYRADDPMRPVNTALLKEPKFEHAGVPLGEPQCYRVRSVGIVRGVSLEGDLSEQTCATPTDVFPPAAPKGLAAVPTAGQISLIWDANAEKDLAGYLVLRGDAPDGPLKALTPGPIKETSYRDMAVKTGVRYTYAIVAVDTATPPNTSAQSSRVEETGQ